MKLFHRIVNLSFIFDIKKRLTYGNKPRIEYAKATPIKIRKKEGNVLGVGVPVVMDTLGVNNTEIAVGMMDMVTSADMNGTYMVDKGEPGELLGT